MSLSPGMRLGSYEILASLGAGGMGEVYRARDTELGRDVAIKVLPVLLADDADRLLRFRREAHLLASLNHPNIGSIYGVAEGDGIRGMVLELVEGQTLQQMVTRSDVNASEAESPQCRLPVDAVFRIGRQISMALAAAHAKGIIHRDLKPANVTITPAGVVKVLDFGLAKEFATENSRDETVTFMSVGQLSAPGSVVGTIAYMSPEQVRGEPLDPRTDLFSLGVVLYELATGRRAFEGSVSPVVFDEILHKTLAPPSHINRAVPPALDAIIARLIEKDRGARFASASELTDALERAEIGPEQIRKTSRLSWLVIAASILMPVAAVVSYRMSKTELAKPSNYVQVTGVSDSATSPALSPDGQTLAFIRGRSTFFGPGQIYVKALPDGEPVQLTDDRLSKMSPVFSPDGLTVAYTTVDRDFAWDTWTVSVIGRIPRLWMKNASGVSWVDSHRLLFSEMIGTGIHMRLVAANVDRAAMRSVYQPVDEQGMVHRSSSSPDGRSVLLVEMVANVFTRCRVVPADGGSAGTSVGPDGECTAAAWSPDGRWMYLSSKVRGTFHIWRQRFPDGRPEQLTNGPSEEEGIAVAPDGRSLMTSLGTQQSAVWLHDERGEHEISGEGDAFVPTLAPSMSQPFSADGRTIFYLVRQGTRSVGLDQRTGAFSMTDVETGRRQHLFAGFDVSAFDVARDGKRVVFAALDDRGRSHLWLAALDGRLTPRQLPPADADSPRFGAHDDIFFRMRDGVERYIFRIGEDGSDMRKVVRDPILFFMSASPQGQWVVARVASTHTKVVAFSTNGGAAVPVCADCEADWGAGGTSFVVRALGGVRSLRIALAEGEDLPTFPPAGLRSEADAAALHVIASDGLRYPGRDASQYAYVRAPIQRNIYRVPIP